LIQNNQLQLLFQESGRLEQEGGEASLQMENEYQQNEVMGEGNDERMLQML
jgi:hypothetical protein